MRRTIAGLVATLILTIGVDSPSLPTFRTLSAVGQIPSTSHIIPQNLDGYFKDIGITQILREEKVIESHGQEVWYATTRVPNSKGWVFLHPGGFIDSTGFSLFAEKLINDGYSVVEYDQPGTGNSSKSTDPEDYTLEALASHVETILDTEGIIQPILIGHCKGAAVLATYAASTGNVSKFVAYSLSSNFSESTDPITYAAYNATSKVITALCSLVAEANESSGEKDFKKMEGADETDLWFYIHTVPFEQRAVNQAAYQPFDAKEALNHLDTESHFIYSSEDFFISTEEGREVAALAPNSTVQEVPQGHCVILTHPDIAYQAFKSAIGAE